MLLMPLFLLLLSLALSERLNPKKIPQFLESIPISSPVHSTVSHNATQETYLIKTKRLRQQILPSPLPATEVFAYGGIAHDRVSQKYLGEVYSSPGPQFLLTKGLPAYTIWENELSGRHLFEIERSFDFMNRSAVDFGNFIPSAPHAHGMTVHYTSDGHPGAWVTESGQKGANFYSLLNLRKNQAAYYWTNEQDECTLYYHDHAAGMTRLNVYAGLVGFLAIEDAQSKLSQAFDEPHNVYLAISDKAFNEDGSLYYPDEGPNDQHPTYNSEFFGDVMVVNGKAWPKMQVKRNSYRVRLLNGCNARFLNLSFTLESSEQEIEFSLVKADSSYYKHPLTRKSVILHPSARVEIVFNFSSFSSGTRILVRNNIGAPYPMSEEENYDSETTGRVMMFEVSGNLEQHQIVFSPTESLNPALNTYPLPVHDVILKRTHVLYEDQLEDDTSNGLYIDGVDMGVKTDVLRLGSTYDFYIVNLSEDEHPIHFHLINFQFVRKAKIDADKYEEDWLAANEGDEIPFAKYPKILDVEKYVVGEWQEARDEEKVFRDVYGVDAQSVHVWRMRFAHNNGSAFGFNAAAGEFVWHCHMLEHEDFAMMRQFRLF